MLREESCVFRPTTIRSINNVHYEARVGSYTYVDRQASIVASDNNRLLVFGLARCP